MANTLAYYDMTTITAINGFIVQAPGNLLPFHDNYHSNITLWQRMAVLPWNDSLPGQKFYSIVL